MGFFSDALAEQQQKQQRPLSAPQVSQSAPEPGPGIEGFWEQAGKLLQGPEPAASFEERYGYSPGEDLMVIPSTARDAAKTSFYHDDGIDRDRERKQMALAVNLAAEAGAFENPADLERTFTGNRAKAARDHAAQVQEAIRAGTWRTAEDTTPGRKVSTTQGVRGFTRGT